MDTRSKIVNATAAPAGAVLVVGYFDVLSVEHVRALAGVRPGMGPLLAVVLPGSDDYYEVLSQQARAEMAAGLRMIDYVLTAARPGQPGDLQHLVNQLRPLEIVPLDETEVRRMRRLIEQLQHG